MTPSGHGPDGQEKQFNRGTAQEVEVVAASRLAYVLAAAIVSQGGPLADALSTQLAATIETDADIAATRPPDAVEQGALLTLRGIAAALNDLRSVQ